MKNLKTILLAFCFMFAFGESNATTTLNKGDVFCLTLTENVAPIPTIKSDYSQITQNLRVIGQLGIMHMIKLKIVEVNEFADGSVVNAEVVTDPTLNVEELDATTSNITFALSYEEGQKLQPGKTYSLTLTEDIDAPPSANPNEEGTNAGSGETDTEGDA